MLIDKYAKVTPTQLIGIYLILISCLQVRICNAINYAID